MNFFFKFPPHLKPVFSSYYHTFSNNRGIFKSGCLAWSPSTSALTASEINNCYYDYERNPLEEPFAPEKQSSTSVQHLVTVESNPNSDYDSNYKLNPLVEPFFPRNRYSPTGSHVPTDGDQDSILNAYLDLSTPQISEINNDKFELLCNF